MKNGVSNKYYVSLKGDISGIDGDWNIFTGVHCNSTKTGEQLTGKNIFKIIKGENVKQLYRDIHNKLEKYPEKEFNFKIRCDSPTSYRLFAMRVRKHGDFVEYCLQLADEKPLTKSIRLDYNHKDKNSVSICAWCKNFKEDAKSNTWLPVEKIFENTPESFQIDQDICPACRSVIEKELNA